jgi:hypothetical protein
MYLDGIPQATYELPGLQSGAAGGYTLNIDVSINPSSLPADVDLPALARVDAVEAWGVTALPNYKQLHGAPVCDPASGGSKRASIRGLVGPDHSLEDCAAGCDDVFDCKYFTIVSSRPHVQTTSTPYSTLATVPFSSCRLHSSNLLSILPSDNHSDLTELCTVTSII